MLSSLATRGSGLYWGGRGCPLLVCLRDRSANHVCNRPCWSQHEVCLHCAVASDIAERCGRIIKSVQLKHLLHRIIGQTVKPVSTQSHLPCNKRLAAAGANVRSIWIVKPNYFFDGTVAVSVDPPQRDVDGLSGAYFEKVSLCIGYFGLLH